MILISGASGFIGKHLTKTLENSIGISLRRLDWEYSFDCQDLSAVINLVGKAHDHLGESTEYDFNYVNIELTKKIFSKYLTSSAKIFIHISSLAAVEEFESKIPLNEESTCNPISFYGKSKRAAEEWLLSQSLPASKKLIILRPPMIHGSGDKGNLLLLYRMISRGIPYPLSAFNNKRSFISIINFTFFINQIICKQHFVESGIYHISDDQDVSTKDIIELIKKVTGKKVINLKLPKLLVKFFAKIGDTIPLPLNTIRLKKMTSDLLVCNRKIKKVLDIENLPYTAIQGFTETIHSFKHNN